MISAKAMHFGDKRTKEMCIFSDDERPVAAQIFGREPRDMADAAKFIADRGADMIDINMGCPVKKILKSGSGVQLMREPELAVKVAMAAVSAVKIPVTVKIRLGWSDEEMNYLELARQFEGAGAAAITLHPRTRVQGFGGTARWEHIARLKESVSVPVIGSGDVTDADSAREMFAVTGCDALMIGRGALGRPWIFQDIADELSGRDKTISETDHLLFVTRHMAMLTELLSGRRSVGHLRKNLAWYSKGMAGGAEFRRTVNFLKEPQEIDDLAREFFGIK
jgi:nifR3 family TIM-barrel protein